MAILATTNSTPRELIPQGNYVARCYKMIEIGTVTELINGEQKQLKKVMIGWEFPNDQKVFDETKGEQPIVVSEEYTLSMGEKSNLRKMLESWRGKGFSADEAKSFDISNLIGKPCMINIIHTPKKSDPSKFYDKISSVTGVPKGMSVPPQINNTFILSYDSFDWDKYNSLPDWIKNKIKASVEFQKLMSFNSGPGNGHPDGRPAPARDTKGNVLDGPATEFIQPVTTEDDLPF